MALPYVQATGNLTRDPELTFTDSGAARLRITLACNNRILDRSTNTWSDGEPTYLDVTVWREMAENVAESVEKGDPITVAGRLKQRKWEQDGQTRTAYEVDADTVGVDLRRRKVKVTRIDRSSRPADDQWSSDEISPF